jgi:thiol-disulfide isomerase/thioredoxin
VLLYWGATWCPPCNQLKATLFNRQDFAALSKSFVAVHVDGDRPGAQKLGQRFKVGGYPTLVLFKPDGSEITRLPGEADAEQVMDLLRLGLAGGRPATQVLADARAGKTLTPPSGACWPSTVSRPTTNSSWPRAKRPRCWPSWRSPVALPVPPPAPKPPPGCGCAPRRPVTTARA